MGAFESSGFYAYLGDQGLDQSVFIREGHNTVREQQLKKAQQIAKKFARKGARRTARAAGPRGPVRQVRRDVRQTTKQVKRTTRGFVGAVQRGDTRTAANMERIFSRSVGPAMAAREERAGMKADRKAARKARRGRL